MTLYVATWINQGFSAGSPGAAAGGRQRTGSLRTGRTWLLKPCRGTQAGSLLVVGTDLALGACWQTRCAVRRGPSRRADCRDLDPFHSVSQRCPSSGRHCPFMGVGELARRVGMSRDSYHKALSEDGNPTWSTILKVTNARTAPHVEVPSPERSVLDVAACANLRAHHSGASTVLGVRSRDDLARGRVCQDVALWAAAASARVAPPDDRDERAPGDGVGATPREAAASRRPVCSTQPCLGCRPP